MKDVDCIWPITYPDDSSDFQLVGVSFHPPKQPHIARVCWGMLDSYSLFLPPWL